MPIYEFKCPNCKHQQEEVQKYSDPGPPCKFCAHHPEMQKIVSAHAKRDWSVEKTKWWE